jgi:hypothetical protein
VDHGNVTRNGNPNPHQLRNHAVSLDRCAISDYLTCGRSGLRSAVSRAHPALNMGGKPYARGEIAVPKAMAAVLRLLLGGVITAVRLTRSCSD